MTEEDNDFAEMEWDEDRGGPRRAENLVSVPRGAMFYVATAQVFPWKESGAHDSSRMTLPVIFVEKLFRLAPAKDPQKLTRHVFMSKCLALREYLAPALTLLVSEGFLKSAGSDDGDTAVHVYAQGEEDKIQEDADRLILQLKDEDTIAVKEGSFEWLEGVDENTQAPRLAWFATLTIATLTEQTKDLRLYIDLALIVGPRATELERARQGSTIDAMIGGRSGGQLAHAIKVYYYGKEGLAQDIPQDFLLRRLTNFLLESQWPEVYRVEHREWDDYGFDLVGRASWKVASRQEWAAMVSGKLAKCIARHLPMLENIFKEHIEQGATTELVREVQDLGDMVLEGQAGQKLPFWHIAKVDGELESRFGGIIVSERAANGNTQSILKKIRERNHTNRDHKAGEGAAGEDEMRGPKPGQLSRAMSAAGYSEMEIKYSTALMSGRMSNDDKVKMVRDLLAAGVVLFQAVLLATKGARMTVYIGQGGSDFLALVHAERHLLGLYLGQSLAYDLDIKAVPTELQSFRLGETIMKHICDLSWEKEDVLNDILLKIRGQEVGTEFPKHPTKNLYHDADMLQQVTELNARKYESLGFPTDVTAEEGVTYRGFMAGIKKLQKFSMALTPEQQKGTHAMIDDLVRRANVAAAAYFKRVVFGPSPSDKKLRAWLAADEEVVLEIDKTLKKLTSTAEFLRDMGSIMGAKPKAAMLPGFGVADSSTNRARDDDGGGNPKTLSRREEKRKRLTAAKTAVQAATDAKTGKPKAPIAKRPVENRVKEKRIFVYADHKFSIGTPSANSHTHRPPLRDTRIVERAQARRERM